MKQDTLEHGMLEIDGLVRQFKEVRALDTFSITVQPGEFLSLLGPSGCGKTTALRIIAGLEKQDSGMVKVHGKDISGVPTHKRNMGMVFQQYSLFPNLTARENVTFGLSMRGKSRTEQDLRSQELFALIGLQGLENRFPHQMSGGQQQRVALARALAFNPEILLLDEPLSALDAQVRVQIREEIRRIQSELGITTIFVTHDQEEAMAISDRIAVMNEGKLEQVDTPSKLYNSPISAFVAGFVGTSNRFRGTVQNGKKVLVFGQEVGASTHAPQLSTGAQVEVYIRPEDVIPAKTKGGRTTQGTVVLKSFSGASTTLGISIGSGPLIHMHGDSYSLGQYEIGGEIGFSIDAENVMFAPIA